MNIALVSIYNMVQYQLIYASEATSVNEYSLLKDVDFK